MEQITILGGGVAGVVAAYHLAQGGAKVTLVERSAQLGGLMRSMEVGGHIYDIGAFIFDKNNAFINTFPGLREIFHETDHLNQVITVNGKLDWYPFSLKGYISDRGYTSLVVVAAQILYAKFRDRKREDLLQYIRYYIGSKLYEETGLRSYIERLYRTTDDTVGVEFGYQRLQSIENDAALRRNFIMIFRRLFGSSVPESDPWRCLVRPHEGFSKVFEHIRSVLIGAGVTIECSQTIRQINRKPTGGFTITTDLANYECDRLISTIPIDQLVSCFDTSSVAYSPEYMSLISLFYTYEGDLGFDGTYLYNFTKTGSWKRLDTFSKYYGESTPHYFAVECTSRDGDGRTIEGERHAFEAHTSSLPVLKGKLRFQGGYLTHNAYPFFRKGSREQVQALRDYAKSQGVEFTGRQGAFAYIGSNQVALASKNI